jgi:hypothetical protein
MSPLHHPEAVLLYVHMVKHSALKFWWCLVRKNVISFRNEVFYKKNVLPLVCLIVCLLKIMKVI